MRIEEDNECFCAASAAMRETSNDGPEEIHMTITRQVEHIDENFGDGRPVTTMDCGPKSTSNSKSTSKEDRGNDDNFSGLMTTTPLAGPGLLATGATRRDFRSPMRRGSKVPKTPSISERDDPSATSGSNKPITVGDVVAHYLKQGAASRKCAMRTKTSRGPD
jgi:hypothetical protein